MELETLNHHKRSRQNAQALVEFSLILPILLFITIGIIEFGRAFFSYVQVTNLHRSALRLASTVGLSGNTYLDCTRMLRTIEDGVFFGTADATVYYHDIEDWDGAQFTATLPADGSCDATGEVTADKLANGDLLVIEVTYTLDFMTPIFTQTLSFDLTGQRTVVRNVDLTGVPFCGDTFCNGNEQGDTPGNVSTYCPEDCVTGSGNPPTISTIEVTGTLNGSTVTNATLNNNDKVSGTITLEVTANDTEDSPPLLTVTLIAEGETGNPIDVVYDGTLPSPPNCVCHNVVIDTATMFTHGSKVSLAFQVKDQDENFSPISTIIVEIDNSTDMQPSGSIDSPPGAATISGDYLVQVTANDNETVDGGLDVDFWVDGGEVLSNLTYNAGSQKYEAVWNTIPSGDGPHTLEAMISDGVTSTFTTATVNIQIDNSSPPGANYPVVSNPSPDGTAPVNGLVPIEVEVTDDLTAPNNLIVEVNIDSGGWNEYPDLTYDAVALNFYLDDFGVLGWDTIGEPNGTHTIQFRAEDQVGNITYFPPIFVEVANPIDSHVFSLSDSPVDTSPTWATTITITVVDQNDVAIEDAIVFGTWSNGYAGTANCTTDNFGQCTVTANNIVSGAPTVKFTVVQISKSGVSYDSSSNVVTTITSNSPL